MTKRYLMRDRTISQRSNSAIKFLANVKHANQCLHYCDYQTIAGTEYQVFTNTFVLFMLVDKLELPHYFDYQCSELIYPNIERIYKYASLGTDITGLIDINDIIYQMKNKTIHPADILNYKLDFVEFGIKAKYIKDIVDILGTIDLRVYYTAPNKPLLFVDAISGNQALAMCFNQIKKGE